MAKKPSVGTICTYCCERGADTWDHVVARAFFLKQHRSEARKVPACRDCNQKKSELESELAIVLPFGARHLHANEILSTAIDKAHRGNNRLAREIRDGISENLCGKIKITCPTN
jgi:hypothetical protein